MFSGNSSNYFLTNSETSRSDFLYFSIFAKNPVFPINLHVLAGALWGIFVAAHMMYTWGNFAGFSPRYPKKISRGIFTEVLRFFFKNLLNNYLMIGTRSSRYKFHHKFPNIFVREFLQFVFEISRFFSLNSSRSLLKKIHIDFFINSRSYLFRMFPRNFARNLI